MFHRPVLVEHAPNDFSWKRIFYKNLCGLCVLCGDIFCCGYAAPDNLWCIAFFGIIEIECT